MTRVERRAHELAGENASGLSEAPEYAWDSAELPFQMGVAELTGSESGRRKRDIQNVGSWFPTVVDNSFVGAFKMSPDGKVFFANVALAALLEYTTLQQMDEDDVFLRLHQPHDWDCFRKALAEHGSVKDFLCSIETRLGTLKAVLISATLKDNVIYGTVLDISEKERANAKLRGVREFSNKIRGCTTLDEICTETSDYLRGFGYPNYIGMLGNSYAKLKIKSAAFNVDFIKRAENYLGCPLVELSLPTLSQEDGKEFPDASHYSHLSLRYLNPKLAAILDLSASTLIPLIARNQLIGIIEVSIVAPSEEDRLFLGTLADVLVTAVYQLRYQFKKCGNGSNYSSSSSVGKRSDEEVRKLRHQLQRAQKMESIGTLAAGIAHDFKNFLSGIQGCASLLLSDMGETHQHYDEIKTIETAALRAVDLANRLLTVTRASGSEKLVCLVNQSIESTVAVLRRSIARNISIELQLDQQLPSIMCNPGQIEQVMMNLGINAADAMPNGGALVIRTGKTELDGPFCRLHPEVTPGEYIYISVRDTGTGIPAEAQQKVFEPLYTTKEPGKGTGLGLSVVYGIVREHGGAISVDSRQGVGSRFTVFLPITTEEKLATPLEAALSEE